MRTLTDRFCPQEADLPDSASASQLLGSNEGRVIKVKHGEGAPGSV